jgi:hypothetical protein
MAVAVASLLLCTVQGRADTATPKAPSFLLFGGTDLWRYGQFLYGGTLWSPGGLNSDGFTLKLIGSGGGYSYFSGGMATEIHGTLLSGAAMPGWRFVRGGFTVTAFAGPVVQDYGLSPYDPGSRLHGLHAGAQFATDIWYQPTANVMAAVSGSLASIGPTGSLRGAIGYRVFDALFAGPEGQMLWCGNFEEFQVGAHLTGFHVSASEWSAAGGWSMDSDKRTGPYLRVGFSVKY